MAPRSWGKPLGYLSRCAAVEILEKSVRAPGLTWTKVRYRGQVGFIASRYVKEGTCR